MNTAQRTPLPTAVTNSGIRGHVRRNTHGVLGNLKFGEMSREPLSVAHLDEVQLCCIGRGHGVGGQSVTADDNL